MELKVKREYKTEKERIDFIVENNHKKGYQIRYSEEMENNAVRKFIEAWGKDDEELFEIAKEQKLSENLDKAYKAEEDGKISFKGALFETSTANTSKLTAQFAMIQAGVIDSVQWLSKDDKQVELSGEDIITLGGMIAEYTGALWNVHYLAYKEQIETCETLDELNVIVIDYKGTEVSDE